MRTRRLCLFVCLVSGFSACAEEGDKPADASVDSVRGAEDASGNTSASASGDTSGGAVPDPRNDRCRAERGDGVAHVMYVDDPRNACDEHSNGREPGEDTLLVTLGTGHDRNSAECVGTRLYDLEGDAVSTLGPHVELPLAVAGELPTFATDGANPRDARGYCLFYEGTPHAYALFRLCGAGENPRTRCEGERDRPAGPRGSWHYCPEGALCPPPWCAPPAEPRYCGACDDLLELAGHPCDPDACNHCSSGTCWTRCEACGDGPRWRLDCTE